MSIGVGLFSVVRGHIELTQLHLLGMKHKDKVRGQYESYFNLYYNLFVDTYFLKDKVVVILYLLYKTYKKTKTSLVLGICGTYLAAHWFRKDVNLAKINGHKYIF